MKLLIASQNPKKLKELQEILNDHLNKTILRSLKLQSLSDFPNINEIKEDGKTFEENAVKKALGYAAQTGLLTLADDSGLSVDVLNGEPGVYSARFAGDEKDDRENCEKVLRLLEKAPDAKRAAKFECVIAIAEPNRLIGTTKGEVKGVILRKLRGSGGFGYDPLFFYPPFNKTFAEVSGKEKHQVSHRSAALKSAIKILAKYLSDNNL